MVTTTLAATVLRLLTEVAPPSRFAEIPTYPEARETVEERSDRYAAIAWDVATVAIEGARSERGQRRAAAVLLGIAWHESGFAKDVDLGPCAPARVKKGGCDGGRARSLWQIQGWTGEGRQDAARVALGLARRSMTACRHLPRNGQLSVYASGTCQSGIGQKRSAELFRMIDRFL